MLTCITSSILALAALAAIYHLLLIKVQGYVIIQEPVQWILTTDIILACLVIGLSLATIIGYIHSKRF